VTMHPNHQPMAMHSGPIHSYSQPMSPHSAYGQMVPHQSYGPPAHSYGPQMATPHSYGAPMSPHQGYGMQMASHPQAYAAPPQAYHAPQAQNMASNQATNVQVNVGGEKDRVNHCCHCILTTMTVGFWLPFWCSACICGCPKLSNCPCAN
jgi:hypothetical protein